MDRQNGCPRKLPPKKWRGKDARMLSCLIYFFGPFSIYYILHDYVTPQAMPHAIPQTHSSFYPHRMLSGFELYPRWVPLTLIANEPSERPHRSQET